MRQPNAIIHMGWAGLWMGTVIGAVYGVLFTFGLAGLDSFRYFNLGTLSSGAFVGGVVGGGFGLPMGVFIGIVLAVAVRRCAMPLRPAELHHLKRTGHYACLGAGLGAFGVILTTGAQLSLLDVWAILIVVVPLCIAFFASIRATNRYVQKLDAFAGGKHKAKRV